MKLPHARFALPGLNSVRHAISLIGLELVACSDCRCPVQDRTDTTECEEAQPRKQIICRHGNPHGNPRAQSNENCVLAHLLGQYQPTWQTSSSPFGSRLVMYYILSPNRAITLQFRQSGLRNCCRGVMQLKPRWELQRYGNMHDTHARCQTCSYRK